MTIDEQLRSAGDRLNAELDRVPVPPVPGRRNLAWQALTVAAAVMVLGAVFGVFAWLLPSTDGATEVVDEGPATTQASPDSITRNSREMVPTGVHSLTSSSEYPHAVADGDGFVWAAGWQHLARIDPATGDTRLWDQSDDEAFADNITGLAPARGGGVWMIQPDQALRWFDGERFRDVVETRSLAPEEGIEAVAEAPDGTLFASLPDRGVFGWDGSSWKPIDGPGPSGGAGMLAVDADGALWVGDLGVVLGEDGEQYRLIGHGLSRYDGERWEMFTAADSAVLSGMVLAIDPLADGTVWVVTDAGVARFDGIAWTEVTTGQLPLSGRPSATVGPDGTVWVASGGHSGAARVAAFDGAAWSAYGPDEGLPAESRLTIAAPIAAGDDVFVATGDGLYRLTGDLWTRVLLPPGEASPGTEDAPLVGIQGMRASGGFLWVWGEDEIRRYDDGRWSFYSGTPGGVIDMWDMAFGDETLWVLADDAGLLSLEGDLWLEVTAAPSDVWRIEADPHTGILWLSTGQDLYRWDGVEMIGVGHPANWPEAGAGVGYVGDIAVTEDGSVWAAGLYGYVPEWGGLARYDDDTGAWEAIRPLGDEDIPASLLAPTMDGDLWVVLADHAAEETTEVLTLVRHESATGDWVVYEDLPEGYPFVMASGGDSVWFAQGGARFEGVDGIAGILRFDGRNWAAHLEDLPVDDTVDHIAVADDGTIWYTVNGELHQLLVPTVEGG